MKRIVLMAIAMLVFVTVSGQDKSSSKPIKAPYKSEPAKGLYVGVASQDDVLMGQQDALSDALLEYVTYQGTQKVSSVSDGAASVSTTMVGSPSQRYHCNIKVVDRAYAGGFEFFLFRILPGDDYEITVSHAAFMSDDELETMSLKVMLKFTDQKSQTTTQWVYDNFYDKGRESVTSYIEKRSM